jgi:hypothetical protein
MEKIDKDKLILPGVILLASIVLGGFFYASQLSKQNSIERQQGLKLEGERRSEELKMLKEQEDKQVRQNCYNEAEEQAKNLLKTKAGLKGGDIYKQAIENDLFLKDDLDKSYEDCLSKNGLKK